MSKGLIAAVATAACFAVEFLQLTEINTDLLNVPVLRWFLGTTFSWHDIGCYLLGVAVAVISDTFFPKLPRIQSRGIKCLEPLDSDYPELPESCLEC
jgi:hypothetical protein